MLNWLPAEHQLNKPELLFEKIDDKTIEAQIQKLMDTRKANESPVEPRLIEALPEITYDDFVKMDIRSATILEAEKVPKTDKLLKLKVDTGLDQRTLVAGIAQYFTPEKIVGKQVSILVNLAPRNIRGIESQGMILMAENPDGSLYFVAPGEGAINGATVK